MRTRAFTLAGAYVLLLCWLSALGQVAQNDSAIHSPSTAKDADDPVAILEVGAATNWNFRGGTATFAPMRGMLGAKELAHLKRGAYVVIGTVKPLWSI